MSADDFVFSDAITQVEVPHITAGRCALIGDAAHCPTFLSGMGSSLALQDAHVLAGCLARDGTDVAATLACYAESVAPIARRYHESALRMRRLLLGHSCLRAGVRRPRPPVVAPARARPGAPDAALL